ncbi:unknown [Phocaeicola coprophilus CAG:333]|nr:unknown [Phocaeicola coprophilus CAG:333]
MAKLVYFMPVSKSYYKKSYYVLFYDVPLLHYGIFRNVTHRSMHILYTNSRQDSHEFL